MSTFDGTFPVSERGYVTTFAGGGATGTSSGSINGIFSEALFSVPYGICRDASGVLYVTDRANHRIRKIENGIVSTFAGSSSGSADGQGTSAQFNSPAGICIDPSGTLYVTETGGHRIRTITTTGYVSTIAGSTTGYINATGIVARFNQPTGICIDTSGILYVADYGNHAIRKIDTSGNVTTFAGFGAGNTGTLTATSGSTNGSTTEATFNNPVGICIDNSGTLYITDRGNFLIRAIKGSVVSTFAGVQGSSAYVDGNITTAKFIFNTNPNSAGCCVDANGAVYISDMHHIRKIQGRVVSTIAGSTTDNTVASPDLLNGFGSTAKFKLPIGMCVDNNGNIYVADRNNNVIRMVQQSSISFDQYAPLNLSLSGFELSWAIENAQPVSSYSIFNNGLLLGSTSALSFTISGIFIGANSFVVNSYSGSSFLSNSTAYTYTPPQNIYNISLIGDTLSWNYASPFHYYIVYSNTGLSLTTSDISFNISNIYTNAYLFYIFIYINNTFVNRYTILTNNTISYGLERGYVTTFAGGGATGTSSGYIDGIFTEALFSQPYGICRDASGVLYVTDRANHRIRKIENGIVSTFAGSGATGLLDGQGTGANFNYPAGICIDPSGTLYVTETGNHCIRKIDTNGNVTIIAGSTSEGGRDGYVNAVGTAARFYQPTGICIDTSGILYVADSGNHAIRKIDTNGSVTTFAGYGASAGYGAEYTNGPITVARFHTPVGICIDNSGTLYITEDSTSLIRVIKDGIVSTLAGVPFTPGYVDGDISTAKFKFDGGGCCVDTTGAVYVSDMHHIRKIHNGVVSTVAGSTTASNDNPDLSNGFGSIAKFNLPTGICVYNENIYVADRNNNVIRMVQQQTTAPAAPSVPTAPALSGYPVGTTTSRNATIGISGEVGTTYRVYKNGSLDVSGTLAINTVYSLNDLSDGAYSVYATLADALGNMSISSTVISWTVDTIAPSFTLSGYPIGTISSRNAVINISGEAGTFLTITRNGSIDVSNNFTGSYVYTLSGLADSSYNVLVELADTVGNKRSQTVQWTVNTAPTNLTLSGTVLSWSIASTTGITSYRVYRNGDQIGTTTVATNSLDISSGIVAGSNSLTVQPFSNTTALSSSSPLVFSPSIPSNLTLSGTVLSWSIASTTGITSYRVYRGTTEIGRTISGSTLSLDISSGIVAGSNSLTVQPYANTTELTTSSPLVFTPSTPTNLTLSGSVLSWSIASTNGISSYRILLNGVQIGTAPASSVLFIISSGIISGTNSLTVQSYANTTVLTSSFPLMITPSTPTNLTLSGTVLSWSIASTEGISSYRIYCGDFQIGTTDAATLSLDISSVIFAGVNTLTVRPYANTTGLTTSSPLDFTSSIPFILTLSGTVLSWYIASTTFITSYRVYREGDFQIGTTDAATFSLDIFSFLFAGDNSLTVQPYSNTSALSVSQPLVVTITPSAPYNLTLSGRFLSWSIDSLLWVSYFTVEIDNGYETLYFTVSGTYCDLLSQLSEYLTDDILLNPFTLYLYVTPYHPHIFYTSSDSISIEQPSIPSNLTLSGTVLSWSMEYTSFITSYTITRNGVQIGTSSTQSLDISSGIVVGSNSLIVIPYVNTTAMNTSEPCVITISPSVPAAPVLSGYPTGTTTSRNATIGISGEVGTTYRVYKNGSVDVSGTLANNTVYSLSGLADGLYSVYATLANSLGNMSISSAVISWTVDTLRPLPPVILTQSGLITSTNATITISGEPLTVYTLSYNSLNISGIVASSGIATTVVSSLSGTTSFYARLTNLAGYTSYLSSILSLTVFNKVPPTPSLSVVYNPTTKIAACTISGQMDTSYALYTGITFLRSGSMTSSSILVNYTCVVGTKYNFRVRLQNIVGRTIYSSITKLTAT